MSDLIDREQAKDAIDKYLVGKNLVTDGTMMARLINEIVIDRLPSAEPTFDARDTQYNLPIGTDLISRQAAITALVYAKETGTMKCGELKCVIEVLNKVPSAQPMRGRWISADAMFGGVPFYCSECGENTLDTVMGKPRWNFCPNCGAKMEVIE